MGMNISDRMEKIAQSAGGLIGLRLELKRLGYQNWDSLELYPVVAFFPKYMADPDVLGIAIRNGYSFRIILGRVKSDYQGLNDWFKYVSLHDTYNSLTEALLDHHKALIATEVDMADAVLIGWEKIVEEVIDGIRPTKYDVDDDDFLIADEVMNITFGLPSNLSDSSDIISILDALRDLTSKNPKKLIRFIENEDELSEVIYESDEFSDDFKSKWV